MVYQVSSYSSRIVGAALPTEGKSILISGFTVVDDLSSRHTEFNVDLTSRYKPFDVDEEDHNYTIGLYDIQNPFEQINWLRRNGTITPEMVEKLGANPNTNVFSNPNPSLYEGLRTLLLGFNDAGGSVLDSLCGPEYKNHKIRSLLGSIYEGDNRLKIPNVAYYIDPKVMGQGDWWETQLFVGNRGLINSSARDVYATVEFLMPKEPSKEWLRGEVSRFERNGTDLTEAHLRELYKELRDGIMVHWIMPREILAWPLKQLKIQS